MADTQKWISLESTVWDYIDQSEQNQSKYLKLWNIAYRWFIKQGLDSFFSVTSVLVPVNANMTANLPDNCLKWAKIGFLNSNGEVYTLRRNDSISKLKPFSSNRVSMQAAQITATSYLSNDYYNYWENGVCCNIYGCGNYNSGEFTVDEKDGLIFLNGISAESLVVEFLGSPPPDKEYKIPIQFQEAAISYQGWQDIRLLPNGRKGGGGEKQERKRDYYNDTRNGKKRYNPFRLDEAYQVSVRRLLFR